MADHDRSLSVRPGSVNNLTKPGDLIPYPPVTLPVPEANALLLRAIEVGNLEIVNFALAGGASPQANADNKWSALMIAAFHGRVDIVERLLAADGTIVSYNEPTGFNALQAALIGHTEAQADTDLEAIVTLLLKAGIDRHQALQNTPRPIDIANTHSLAKVIVDLLDKGLPIVEIAVDVIDFDTDPDEEKPSKSDNLTIAFAVHNSNVSLRSDGSGFPIAVLEPDEAVHLLSPLDPEKFARVRLDSGAEGYVLGRSLSLTSVDAVQYGAACLDKVAPFDRIVSVRGLPTERAAKVALSKVAVQGCTEVMTFSGNACFAIAFTGKTREKSVGWSISTAVGREAAVASAFAKCRAWGKPCEAKIVWGCAKAN